MNLAQHRRSHFELQIKYGKLKLKSFAWRALRVLISFEDIDKLIVLFDVT